MALLASALTPGNHRFSIFIAFVSIYFVDTLYLAEKIRAGVTQHDTGKKESARHVANELTTGARCARRLPRRLL
jgi:ABC-type amino acid transport system permease subunit